MEDKVAVPMVCVDELLLEISLLKDSLHRKTAHWETLKDAVRHLKKDGESIKCTRLLEIIGEIDGTLCPQCKSKIKDYKCNCQQRGQ